MLTPPRLCFGALVLGLGLLPSSTTAAQQQPFASVHWPLLDVVTVPDSCTGLRVIVAPSPATTAWKKGPQVVQFGLDPVEALQWATLARAFAHSDTATSSKPRTPLRYLPALRPSRGRRLLLLADYGTRAKPDRRYVLVVSDSAARVHYKTFASAAEVDRLADAIAVSAELGHRMLEPADGGTPTPTLTEDAPGIDSPVRPEHFPRLEYPPGLLSNRRIGRVWMQYVVGTDGRPEPGSYQTLLTDDPKFTASVVRMLQAATFRPATAHGLPVRQRVFQVFTFLVS